MAIPSLVARYRPIVQVPKEGNDRQLIEALYETYPNYVILWFHWPHDDYSGKEDYEPVILVVRDGLLTAIGIRPHKKHKHATRWQAEGERPVITFTTPWHGPMINPKGVQDWIIMGFSTVEASETRHDYALVPGSAPSWFVKDDTDVSIYDYADQIVKITRT